MKEKIPIRSWLYKIWGVALITLSGPAAGTNPSDPYQSIEVHRLKNGMTIVVAPGDSARTVVVEMRILGGWNVEPPGKTGVSRVTAKALFRDRSLRFQQSYLQRVREAGGEAEASVTFDHTSFLATVPTIRGIWAINEFASMVFDRTLDEESFLEARRQALLELGLSKNWLTTLSREFIPRPGQGPSFLETEFSILRPDANPGALRHSIRNLTLPDVQSYYKRFFVPNNMVLFIAGPFKSKATLNFVKETFDSHPPVFPPESLSDLRKVEPRRERFQRSRVTLGTARMDIGTKFWEIGPEDEVVLKVYFEYLAQRISDELRERFGEGFTAETSVWVDPLRFGYAKVGFDVPPDHFSIMQSLVERMIHRETIDGFFTDEAIDEARAYYRRHVQLIPGNAKTLAELAVQLYAFQSKYNIRKSPYEVLAEMDNETFREHMRGLFHPRKAYVFLEEPPALFRGESILFYLLAVLAAVLLCRHLYLREFPYTSIRYMRKIKYQPVAAAVVALIYLNFLWFTSQAIAFLDRLLLHSNWIQSTYFLSQYFEGAITVFVTVVGTVSYLCLVPRKVLVTDKYLYLKSLSYASHKIDILAIKDVIVCRPHHLISHKLWNWKTRLLHWTPWRKGLLVRLDNGVSYYLGFNNAEQTAEELRDVFSTHRPSYTAHYHDVA